MTSLGAQLSNVSVLTFDNGKDRPQCMGIRASRILVYARQRSGEREICAIHIHTMDEMLAQHFFVIVAGRFAVSAERRRRPGGFRPASISGATPTLRHATDPTDPAPTRMRGGERRNAKASDARHPRAGASDGVATPRRSWQAPCPSALIILPYSVCVCVSTNQQVCATESIDT